MNDAPTKRQTTFELLDRQTGLIVQIEEGLGTKRLTEKVPELPTSNKLEAIYNIIDANNKRLESVLGSLSSI